jgi:hypothetical protein
MQYGVNQILSTYPLQMVKLIGDRCPYSLEEEVTQNH